MSGFTQNVYAMAFTKSPIVLTGGIAESLPFGMLPVMLLTQPLSFAQGLFTGGSLLSLDDSFATFQPLPGGSLIENDLGRFPFANQGVAANAIIAQPRTLDMRMICPAKGPFGYAVKTATMLALREALAQHCAKAGTFTVMTPSSFFTNGILRSLRDAGSSGESKQLQTEWVWSFEFPLLTLEAAQSAQNSMMSKLTGGAQISGQPAWSGLAGAVGTGASSYAASLFPASTSTPGTTISSQNLPPVPGAAAGSGYNLVPAR